MRRLAEIIGEDAPTNNAGAGHVDGIGVGPRGEPGGIKSILKRMIRRNPPYAAAPKECANS